MIETREISFEELLPLRHAVLRPGRPLEAAHFEGDHDETTAHFGAFDGDELVAVATLLRHAEAWQLRGMASREPVRGRGFGSAVLDACLARVGRDGGGRVWCNVRRVAVPFYQRRGFVIEGEEFEIPGIGPHFRMVRKGEEPITDGG